MEKAMKRMKDAEQFYFKMQENNKELERFINLFEDINANRKGLSKYYFNEWLADYETLSDVEFINGINNEDTAYNEIADQYSKIKTLLLLCAEYINDEE